MRFVTPVERPSAKRSLAVEACRRHAHDRNSREYCVSWRMAAMSERKAQPPRSARVDRDASRASARTRGRSAARIFCPAVWPIGPSRTDGGDGVGEQRQHEGLQARFERQIVARRGGGDRDRIGDARPLPPAPAAVRSPTRRGRRRRRRNPARSSRAAARPRPASATARPFASISASRSPASRRAEGGGEQDRVGARGAEGQEIDQPAAERARVGNVARLDRPFEPVRIGERADREGRRQPQHQRQQRGDRAQPCSCP